MKKTVYVILVCEEVSNGSFYDFDVDQMTYVEERGYETLDEAKNRIAELFEEKKRELKPEGDTWTVEMNEEGTRYDISEDADTVNTWTASVQKIEIR